MKKVQVFPNETDRFYFENLLNKPGEVGEKLTQVVIEQGGYYMVIPDTWDCLEINQHLSLWSGFFASIIDSNKAIISGRLRPLTEDPHEKRFVIWD
ncbi:hypothetical protein A2450_02540 [candidate division WWE3 bacterium RIFOXYC2_FULL_40_11]|nr:MAG: hypothetical protein A2450_02540 [candidate division WWE3 bacterium RIFOXYC2_FULL_40_11]OGC70822.1 MAG: hypothetical protein A2602_03285 [candidate division WWE3 bacterium RIFOXYD1_FULL_40_11]